MNSICECSGGFKLEVNTLDFWKKIRIVRDIAEYYRFESVAEMADDLLRFNH